MKKLLVETQEHAYSELNLMDTDKSNSVNHCEKIVQHLLQSFENDKTETFNEMIKNVEQQILLLKEKNQKIEIDPSMKKLDVYIREGGFAHLDFNYEVFVPKKDIKTFLKKFKQNPYLAMEDYEHEMVDGDRYNVDYFDASRQVGMYCSDENGTVQNSVSAYSSS